MELFRNFFLFETTPRMTWERPKSVPYPNVWHRFQGRRPGPDGKVQNFKIQDLTDDLVDDALALLLEHFVADESPCRYVGLKNYPSALKEIESMWRKAVEDRVSIVCVIDDPKSSEKPQVVGVNILTVNLRGVKETADTTDEIWRMLIGAVLLVANSVDVCELYDVDKYLGAMGLVIAPEFRGQNMGVEILRARIPICKTLGFKVTATVFTATASQIVAQRTGFKLLSEIKYSDMAKDHGFVFPGIDTKSSKLMALEIVD